MRSVMSFIPHFICSQDPSFGLCDFRDLICISDQTNSLARLSGWFFLYLKVGAAQFAQYAVMLFTFIHSLLFFSSAVCVVSSQDYRSNTEAALTTLQKWYNYDTGIYNTTGWWNSANCITVLGNLAAADPSTKQIASDVFAKTLVQAPKYNLQLNKFIHEDFLPHSHYGPSPHMGVKAGVVINPKGFLNNFYDDEGWWALAWIQAYDVTNNTDYLKTAVDIFEDMKNGSTTPCSKGTSGIWWDKNHTYVNAIANELYLSVAAHLANRMGRNSHYYLEIAQNQWAWFQNSGMINSKYLINDGLQNCRNNGAKVWSYNQGVILGGLVELNKASPNITYLANAISIGISAISNLSDAHFVLHDPCEPNCGPDGSQFKGIFMRNLQKLHAVAPNALFLRSIGANAASIWHYDHNSKNELGVVWSGPFVSPANASTQSSAMDALVAAVASQGQLGYAIAS
jgi:predicted alpha-1,6-mannanase (GH76 family)